MTALDNAPSHWTRTTIGEIADVRLGRQRSPKNHSGDQMRPYLRAANVDWYSMRLDDVAEMNFTDDEMDSYALRAGDVLVVEGSGSASEVGKCVVVPQGYEGHGFQNTLIRLRPGDGIDSRWLMYRVNAEAELGGFLALARGSGIFHLGSKRTGTWPIAVPQLDEQQRIVAEIERLLSRLFRVTADVASGSRRLEHMDRASVEALLATVQDHPIEELGDLVDVLRNGGPWTSAEPAGPGTPILKISAIRPGRFRGEELAFVTDDVGEGDWERFEAKPGSVLFTRYNGNPQFVAGCAVVPELPERTLHPDKLIRVETVPDLDPHWLALVSRGGPTRRHIEAHIKTTSGQAGIAGRDLKSAPVPLPPLIVQCRLVQQFRASAVRSRRLDSSIATTEVRTEALRRSILKAAFEGRL